LRRECSEWRSERWYRPLGVAPFLLPALHDVWPAHTEFIQETFGVPHIYCLLPRFELWSKRFCDWTDVGRHGQLDSGTTWNVSAFLDLAGHLNDTPRPGALEPRHSRRQGNSQHRPSLRLFQSDGLSAG
jgi:hypothetical protein